MNKKTFDNIYFISQGIICITWILVLFINVDLEKTGFCFWGGIVFGLISHILSAYICFNINSKTNINTTESTGILIILSIVYLAVAMMINTIFAFKKDGEHGKLLVVLNLISMAIYIIAMLSSCANVERIKQQADVSIHKTLNVNQISMQIGKILGIVSDEKLKKKIYLLKEKVDYSTNTTNSQAAYYESNIMHLLQEVELMVLNSNYIDAEKRIEQIDIMWSERNSISNTIR